MNLAKRVRRGAKYLDEHRPGWEEQINTDTLELSNPSVCILGQALGDFYSGLNTLGLNERKAEKYGFTLKDSDVENLPGWDDDDRLWSQLTEEWVTLVDNRLHPDLDSIPEPPAPTITVAFSHDVDTRTRTQILMVIEDVTDLLPDGSVTITYPGPKE